MADHRCNATTEIKTATGCCLKNDPYCAAQPQQCAKQTKNPIDILTGAKVQSVVDYATEGPRSLAFERFYRSNFTVTTSDSDDDGPRVRTHDSRFGRAWRSNFDTAIGFAGQGVDFASPADGDRVSVVTVHGEETAFIYNGPLAKWEPAYFDHTGLAGGTWRAPRTDIETALTVVNAGGIQEARIELKNDRTYVYDFNGALKEIRWPDGYEQTLNGTSSVTDSHGRTLAFTYNGDGLLATMTTPENKVYRYSYLSRATMPAGFANAAHREKVIEKVFYPDATPANPLDDPFVTYHYENSDHTYALTGITDERGVRFATYGYDSQGRAISSTHAGADATTVSYDDANGKRTVVNPLTKQTVYNFVNFNGNRQLTSVQGLASANCAAANTGYAYDANGFVSQTTDAEGRVTTFVNNPRGLPTSITEGFGSAQARTTTLAWHATLNRPTQIVAPRLTSAMTYASGRLTQLTQTDTTTHTLPYSTNGQMRTWAYGYSASGQLLTVNGPLAGAGDTLTYTYDASGFVATITDEMGHVTQVLTKNASGQPLTIRDANGIDTALTYDERNRLKTVTVNPGAGQAVTTLAYDLGGNITRITEPDATWLDYTYDDARRVTLIKNNVDQKIRLTYDAVGNETGRTYENTTGAAAFSLTRAYDELGRLLRSIGAASQTTVFAYDRTDLLTTVTDPRSNIYGYAYDALSRLIRETDQELAQVNYGLDAQDNVATYADPRALATAYVRNGFGEVIQEASPDAGPTVYHRDARGDVTSLTDGRGVVTNHTYDDMGRMLSKTYPALALENVTYSYDATASGNKGIGRLTSVSDQSGSMNWVYDARGNVAQETRLIGPNSYVMAYGYNAADRLTQVTYPSGRIVTLTRNVIGEVSAMTMKKTPASASENVATGIAYRPMTEIVSNLTWGNGLTYLALYDLDLRLTHLRVRDGAIDILGRNQAYADGLNLTSISDTLTPANNQTLGYTPANRLGTANGPYGSITYTYDGVGNRAQEVKVQGGTTTTVFGYPSASNRLSSLTVNGSLARSFTYDGAGNMLTGVPLGPSYALVYTKRNRPGQLNLNGAVLATYAFNALEQMAKRTALAPLSPTGTTQYVYDLSGNLIAEAYGNGAVAREYLWLDSMPVAVIDGVNTATPVTSFVHADHLMRPILMTDAAKASIWSATWTPWGTPHAITGTAAQPLRFPGQYYQIETGLHYNWHRHYDPTTGRYAQPDPLGMPDGPGRYVYVRNSPLMHIDPDGRFAKYPPGKELTSPLCTKMPEGGGGGGGGAGGGSIGAGVIIGAGVGALADWFWDSCVSAYKNLSGSGGGGGGGKKRNDNDRDPCEERLELDRALCVGIAGARYGKRGIAICQRSAMERYSECLRGGLNRIRTPLHGVETPL